MRRFALLATLLTAVALSACVTINVYFPAAAAEQAAQEFIGKVIGDETPPPPPPGEPQAARGAFERVLDFLIPAAHAQAADINIRTPQILAIQERMAERFRGQLQAHFESGAIGLGNDGLIEVRDPAAVPLRERSGVNQLVAEDNRDRNAVYREIAVANNHPEWEQQIRETFARQWVESARAGWWYRDAGGAWRQK